MYKDFLWKADEFVKFSNNLRQENRTTVLSFKTLHTFIDFTLCSVIELLLFH